MAGGERDIMHALAEFGVALSLGQVVAAGAGVARAPGLAAVLGVEHAGGGDADPEPARIGGVGDDRMQDQPRAARLPFRPRGVAAQALELR